MEYAKSRNKADIHEFLHLSVLCMPHGIKMCFPISQDPLQISKMDQRAQAASGRLMTGLSRFSLHDIAKLMYKHIYYIQYFPSLIKQNKIGFDNIDPLR